MRSVGIIADDLTGAMDTAHGFAARGHGTSVVAVPPASGGVDSVAPDSPILSVNTDTRYERPETAASTVRTAVESMTTETVYKKVDSTLRGNVGAETVAALSATDADLAVFAPAFPDAGRTTEGGVHYVDGVPVDETEYGTDWNAPSSAVLAAVFEGYDGPVEHVPRGVVEAGSERVAAALTAAIERADRPPVVVCDAISTDDLATIAAAGAGFDALYVGSGGLAEHVAVPEPSGGTPPSLAVESESPLAVVGSVNKITFAQLERLPDEHVVELDPVSIAVDSATADAGTAVDTAAKRAADRLAHGRPAVLTAATDRETVDRTTEAGLDRGLARGEIHDRIAAALARAGREAFDVKTPSGLFYAGGDIAAAGLRSLGATMVELTAETVAAGVPVGRLADGAGAGTPVITKAGGFGSPATIVNCLDALEANDD